MTRAGKQALAVSKLGPAREAIDAVFARLCSRCASSRPPDGREVVVVLAPSCSYCGGSANAGALRELAEECAQRGVRRLVVVGGSPAVRQEMMGLGSALELRLIEGTERRTKAEAAGDVEWADVIVVCGASELNHKVSNLYTRDPRARKRLAVSSRRGVEAIAGAVVEHLRRRA